MAALADARHDVRMHEPPASADVAVVVVHGIGEQLRGATLLEWAEPIAARLDHQRGRRGRGKTSVVFADVTTNERAQVWIESSSTVRSTQTFAFYEARWTEAFLAFDSKTFISWAVGFVGIAARRAAVQTFRVAVSSFAWDPPILPSALRRKYKPFAPDSEFMRNYFRLIAPLLAPFVRVLALVLRALGAALAGVMSLFGAIVYVLIMLPVPVLAGIGLVILGVLARLPLLGRRIQPLLVALTSTVGDAAAWTRSPIRADAMRDVVRTQVARALAVAPKVVVIAHSQGAAVAARALFRDDFCTRSVGDEISLTLVTVGGANTLLRDPTWKGRRGAESSVVSAWAALPDRVRWINIWASLDPVPAGPVAATDEHVGQRWREIRDAPVLALRKLKLREPGLNLDSVRWFTAAGGGQIHPLALLDDGPEESTDRITGWNVDAFEALPRRTWERRRNRFNAALREVRLEVGRGPGPVGPEEWLVENRLSLFRDHTTYTTNVIEVIDPIADMISRMASGQSTELVPMIGRVQQDHRNGLSVLMLARLAIAILSFSLAPVVAGVVDQWLASGWLIDGPLKDWTGDIGGMIAIARQYGPWVVLLLVLTASVIYLIAASLVTSVWLRYDRALAWEERRSTTLATIGVVFNSLVFLLVALAVVAALLPWTTDLLVLGIVAVYTALFSVLPVGMRVSLLPLPERRASQA